MKKQTKSEFSSLNDDATYAGAVRSSIGTASEGAKIVSSGARSLLRSANESMSVVRVETFDMAMKRLKVDKEDIPLIHNQIVVQVYLAFFIGVIALAMGVKHYLLGSQVSAFGLAFVIGLTSIVYAVQSSVQSFQIREMKLNQLSEWFFKISEWFPSRIPGLVRMTKRDPLRAPKIIESMVQRSRLAYYFGFAFGLVAIVLIFTDIALNNNAWSVLLAAFAIILLMVATRNSFEAFRRREGIHCDLGLWLNTPKDWFPMKNDSRTQELKKYFTADGKLNVENSASSSAIDFPE